MKIKIEIEVPEGECCHSGYKLRDICPYGAHLYSGKHFCWMFRAFLSYKRFFPHGNEYLAKCRGCLEASQAAKVEGQ